jgi:hypothetical protein
MPKLIFCLMMVSGAGLPTIAVAQDCRQLRRACEMRINLVNAVKATVADTARIARGRNRTARNYVQPA